jgi:peptide/nickel transport system substrate-binding protein
MNVARRNLLTGAAAAAATPWPLRPARAAGTPKRGGILRSYHPDSPASMSMLEETTISVVAPMMSVFSSLVTFDPRIPQNSLKSVIPDLATDWSWSDGGRQLDFTLRRDVTWHDGRPFTAADVVHTWDLIQGRLDDKLRINPRASWYANVEAVVAPDAGHAAFRLKRPQPALVQLLAAAGAPVYPAHVPARDMRTHPIGTGSFKFAEYKRGEVIRITRNERYWKPERPFLDGVEWSIVPNRSTAILGFVSGKFDMTFPATISMPLLKDVLAQVPDAVTHIAPTSVSGNVTINLTVPPFNDPALRRALALALDRGEFVRIMTDGKGLIGGAMMPPPNGVWGMPPGMLDSIDFYRLDLDTRRTEARRIMTAAGYGPARPLAITVAARNLPNYRDAGIVMIDQLRSIWIEGTLETVDTAVWDAKMIRRAYTVAFNQTGAAVDDPDVSFFENYACGTSRNFGGYCDPEMDRRFLAQSLETDQEKRRQMVWEIDRKLQQDAVRPIMYHGIGATCWHPNVHGLSPTSNSLYNGWRMEDVWLET